MPYPVDNLGEYAKRHGKYKRCLQCQKEFYDYPSGKKKFCSRPCAMTYRNLIDNPAKKPEVKEKIGRKHRGIKKPKLSKTRKRLFKEGKLVSPCIYRTEETFRKVSETKKRLIREGKLKMPRGKNHPCYGKPAWSKGLTAETDERIRKLTIKSGKTQHKKYLSGELKPTYPKPFFVSFLGHKVRSEWEKIVMMELKKKNIDYEYETKRFEIDVDGKKLVFIPDVIIKDIICEIRGPIHKHRIKKLFAFYQQYSNKFFIITEKKNFKKLVHCCDKIFDIEKLNSFIEEIKTFVST